MDKELKRLRHNHTNRLWAKRNRSKVSALTKMWRRKRSAFVVSLKQGKSCLFCGESHIACLDFHHRDRTHKISVIQELARSTSDNNRVLEEVKKCDLICSNCHRKKHYEEKLSGWKKV